MDTGTDLVGIARQTAKGTFAAAPAFAHGVSGSGFKTDITQEPVKITSAYLSPANARRSKSENSVEVATLAFTKSLGLYLLAALGNVVTTGAAAPYTHVFTLGDSLPYLSVWSQKGDGTIIGLRDCKPDELAFEWEGNDEIALTAKLAAGVLSFPTTFVPVVDESDSDAFFTPVGGTFKYDLDSATPAAADVKSGKLTIARGAEARFYSGAIEAGNVLEGACNIEVGLIIDPEDMSVWRTLATGAAAGTGISEDVVYGSLELDFVAGSDSLKIAAPRVAFLVDIPEADPEGGPAESELAGICYRVDDTPITVTLVNGQATY